MKHYIGNGKNKFLEYCYETLDLKPIKIVRKKTRSGSKQLKELGAHNS